VIFRTFPVHFGTVTVAWDADNDTFYALGSNRQGQRLWEYARGMPCIWGRRFGSCWWCVG
jgi:hypothetical protein